MKLRGNPKLKALDRYVLGTLIQCLGYFKHQKQIASTPHSVLLIKLNALGDTLLFLSVARILKNVFPGIVIDFLGSEINLPVLDRCPHLDRIIVLKLARIFRHPFEFISLLKKIRQARYDVVIDGSQWERLPAAIALLSQGRVTIGFDTPGHKRSAAFHYPIPHQKKLHEIDCFLNLLFPLGIHSPAGKRQAYYWVRDEDRQKLNHLPLPEERWVVLHPGCGVHGVPREWPAKNYVHLADLLRREFPDCRIVISGQESERLLCRQIAEGVQQNALDLCGSMDFHLLGSLVEKAALVVCGNTGVMHLAAALNTPVVALHGPTDPVRWGPLSPQALVIQSRKACAPCLYLGYEYDCDCPSCMEEISVEEVYNACCTVLRGSVSEVRDAS